MQVAVCPYHDKLRRLPRVHNHTASGPSAAPVTAGTIRSAFTSATWILSGSIRPGKASEFHYVLLSL